ncbi:hypothetical protein OG272_15515 [Streptomyces sp. NBC_00104]|uniref:hypothetical protein n=1 Tax=Streptomyces sp. NBC_00104 TaxID=2903621 RepID=UPI003250DEDB
MERHWVTGDCWLGCQSIDVLVIWLGPLQWDGQHAPVFTCEPCLNRIKTQALAYFLARQPDHRLTKPSHRTPAHEVEEPCTA